MFFLKTPLRPGSSASQAMPGRRRRGRLTYAMPIALFPIGLLPYAGCSSSSTPSPVDSADADLRPPTPAAWDRDVTRPDDPTAASARAACKYSAGALPGETLGATYPVDKDIPIQTIVVFMQENRSFDTYYGHLNKFAGRNDVESAPDTTTNPTVIGSDAGAGAHYQHAPHRCFIDTNHEWSGSHLEWDNGLNDGFYEANQPPLGAPSDGERALWWYDETDLPFYYKLASTFAIGDHYHCSVLGPTWPNRMYLYSATSFGRTTNEFPDISAYPFPDKDVIVFDELEKRHVDWNVYSEDLPVPAIVVGPAIVSRWGRNPAHTMDEFFAAAAAGTLPAVSFLDAKNRHEFSNGDDEHPPADVQVGQKLVSDVVHAMFKSPQWPQSALFLTYDEHGGTYDHVPPPAACKPDNTAPILSAGDPPGAFDRYGFRVPLTVVSPYAKKSFVSHVTYDHTSITRFIQTKFKLPALTNRDANADALLDMFDFKSPPFTAPPDIPEPTVDPVELGYCEQTYPPPKNGM
jgi:phospholipase C